MPHPVAVIARDTLGLCPHDAPQVARRLRREAGAPLVLRVGPGWLMAQTPEEAAGRVSRVLEALTGSRAILVEPPDPPGPGEALQAAVAMVDAGLHWIAHEVLEHAWHMGAHWLHPATVATAAWAKAQEGAPEPALWISGTLLPRSLSPGTLPVDQACVERVTLEILACTRPQGPGECLAPRAYGPWPMELPGVKGHVLG